MHEISQLDNRLKVVTIPMRERDSVGVGVWVRVGSRFEARRESGISHFIEHLVFKGTRRRTGRQIKEAIEGVGGAMNAFTAEEFTCYLAKLPQAHLAVGVDVLADMVRSPLLRPSDMEKERKVVLEELKMYEDLPAHVVAEMMSELLWPGDPLGLAIGGSEKTVRALRAGDLVRFSRRFYHPANVVVAVAGPVRHSTVVEAARAAFDGSRPQAPSRFRPARERQRRPRYRLGQKKTEQAQVVLGFRSFSRRDPRRHALTLLHVILGANMSSRLFEEVRERRGLAYDIKTHVSTFEDTGAFSVGAGVEERKVVQALRVILAELARISRRAPQPDELRRAKDYYVGQLLLALEDTLDHMLWVGEKVLYDREVPSAHQVMGEIARVGAPEVSAVARDIFRPGNLNFTLVSSEPKKLEGRICKELGLR